MFPTLDTKSNFLGLEKERSSFEQSRIVILSVPYERTVSYGGGTRNGPAAILRASHFIEFYDEETGRDIGREFGVATLKPLTFPKGSQEQDLDLIYRTTKKLLQSNKFIVALGGEHTITQALIAAHAEQYHDLSVIQIDAHSDLRDEYRDNKYSHASVMARVCEFVDPRRVVQIGIRAQAEEEAQYIRERGVTTMYAHEIRAGRHTKLLRYWDDVAIERLGDHVYVTFDVDGLDPSIMPSTGTPEPNGLFWHETTTLLRKLGERKSVVGCDVVEFAPMKNLVHPDLTAARLVSKMINYFIRPSIRFTGT
jgi:agmatinase